MAFVKGKSGNPGGKHKERLFRTALVLELKAAGEDMPDLREIARALGLGSHFNILKDRIETPGDGIITFAGMLPLGNGTMAQ